MKHRLLFTFLLLSPLYLHAMSMDDGTGNVNTGGGESAPLIGSTTDTKSSNPCAQCCASIFCFPCTVCYECDQMKLDAKLQAAKKQHEIRTIIASMPEIAPERAAAVKALENTNVNFFCCTCNGEGGNSNGSVGEDRGLQRLKAKLEFNRLMKEEYGYEEDKAWVEGCAYNRNVDPLSTELVGDPYHLWTTRYKKVGSSRR